MKINKLLPVSLLLVMGIIDAKNQCFRSYNINVVNKSGGVAKLLQGREIAGMTRGSVLSNNSTKRLVVNDLGAHLAFLVGPEDQKQIVSVSLYDTTGTNPHVILEPRAIKAFDINTAHGKQYDVMIKNESGGIATITGCGAKEVKIANGSSTRMRAHAGATAHVVAGREGHKNRYVIHFFEKTGEHSSIFLGGGEFFSSGVKAKGVNIKVTNGLIGRLSTGLAPKKRHAMPQQPHAVKKSAKNAKAPMKSMKKAQ